jgi:putative glycerol kinase 5
MRSLRCGGKLLYGVSRQPRYKAASILQLYNKLVTLRLLWALDNVPGLRQAANQGETLFLLKMTTNETFVPWIAFGTVLLVLN